MSINIPLKPLAEAQLIDQMPFEIACEVIKRLEWGALLNLSRVSTKWYNWVISYAPRDVKKNYPEHYREGISGEQALACLVSQSIAPLNLPKGLFNHVVIKPDGLPPNYGSTRGFSKHRFLITSCRDPFKTLRDPWHLFMISSRTGAIKICYPREIPKPDFYLKGLMWRQTQHVLQGRDLHTGVLNYEIPVPIGHVMDMREDARGSIGLLMYHDAFHFGLLDLQEKRIRQLALPEQGYTVASGACSYPDFCTTENSVSVIWFHENGHHLLAVYPLNSREDPIPAKAKTPFPIKVGNNIYARREHSGFQLIELKLNPIKLIKQWFIIDPNGKRCFEKPIFKLVCMEHLIILLVEEHEKFSFQAFDPSTRSIIWSCPIEGKFHEATFRLCIMHAVSKERIFLYGMGTYLLLDLPSQKIVKWYQFEEFKTLDYDVAHFDGEKIIHRVPGAFHILDFTYRQEAPHRTLNLSCSPKLLMAGDTRIGENYTLVPHRIVNLKTSTPSNNNYKVVYIAVSVVAFSVFALFFKAKIT